MNWRRRRQIKNGSLHLRWGNDGQFNTKWMRLCKYLPECKNCLSILLIRGHYRKNIDSKSGAYQSNWLSINRRTVWLQLKMSLATVKIYAHILMDSGIGSSKRVYIDMANTHTHARAHSKTHKCVNGRTHEMLLIKFNRLRILPFWIIFLSVSYIK